VCGIAGIVGKLNESNRSALSRMEQAIAHRGPDSTGFWTSAPDGQNNGCLFAHRRLSILDLSSAADQPMVDPASGQCIIFNGEIYNFRELRRQLQAEGEHFDSTGDTAVMLRLLARKGPAALRQLRGMFAFALWDDKSRQLTLARDPLGIKPLYVAQNPDPAGDWSLLFASEVRSLLASNLIERKLDPAAVSSVVWNGFVPGPHTIVKGVRSLFPGEVRIFASGREASSEIFWKMPHPLRPTPPTTAAEFRETLRECIRLHLVSDVPLGVFLSSGVDSSAVANLAQKVSPDARIKTFTLAFEEQSLNEGQHARAIADAIGTEHTEILLTEERFVENLERALETLDQPTFDGLNSFYMSHAVREAGLTVALVGTGGDELFGGYTSFRFLPKLQRWDRRLGVVPRGVRIAGARLLSRLMHGSAGAVGPQTRWAKLPDMLQNADDLVALYQLAYALFLPDFQDELMSKDGGGDDAVALGLPAALLRRLREEIAGRSPLAALSVLEQRCFLGERLLRDSDAASMAVSLELRVPLVDSVLTESVAGLPDALRFQPLGRKQLLRMIGLEGLDPALFERPKSGFVLPFDKWIRQRLGQAMHDTMLDESAVRAAGLHPPAVARLWEAYQSGAAGMYWSRVWAIYVLIRWCQRHQVTI